MTWVCMDRITRTASVFLAAFFVTTTAFGNGISDIVDLPEFSGDGAIVQYNFDEYTQISGVPIESIHEAPMLAQMVMTESLPPVHERLPDDPLVVSPSESVGTYGDDPMIIYHDASSYTTSVLDSLLIEYPVVYDSRGSKELRPNVFQSWQIINDGKTFEFKIRPGMKWSDGTPFSADDFMFWYDAVALNQELTPNGVDFLKHDGDIGQIEKIDQNTIRMTFESPNATFLERFSLWPSFPYRPAHYLKQFHPTHVDPGELDSIVMEEGFSSWVELFNDRSSSYNNPKAPTIFAWKAENGLSDEVQEFRRNPYYWKVDSAGNQLPYFDRVLLQIVSDSNDVLNQAILGNSDYALVVPNSHSYRMLTQSGVPLYRIREPDGRFSSLFPDWNTAVISEKMQNVPKVAPQNAPFSGTSSWFKLPEDDESRQDDNLRHAARIFAAKEDGHEKKQYAVHGAILFRAIPTDDTRDLYMTICEVFVSMLSSTKYIEEKYASLERQAVTAWPIIDSVTAETLNDMSKIRFDVQSVCTKAVDNIDPDLSTVFVAEALTASGESEPRCLQNEGPHLIAWSSQPQALIAMDLRSVKDGEVAREKFAKWESEILDPDSWKNGEAGIILQWFEKLGAIVLVAMSGERVSIGC